ncbi:unnamed protein product, partial [Prorocentrum cordatum]
RRGLRARERTSLLPGAACDQRVWPGCAPKGHHSQGGGGAREEAHGATRPRAVACARPAGGRALSPAASRRRGAPPRRHARPPPACAGVGCTTEAASAASRSPAGDFRHEAKARVCPPPT